MDVTYLPDGDSRGYKLKVMPPTFHDSDEQSCRSSSHNGDFIPAAYEITVDKQTSGLCYSLTPYQAEPLSNCAPKQPSLLPTDMSAESMVSDADGRLHSELSVAVREPSTSAMEPPSSIYGDPAILGVAGHLDLQSPDLL